MNKQYRITLEKGIETITRTRQLNSNLSDYKRKIQAKSKLNSLMFSGWKITEIEEI